MDRSVDRSFGEAPGCNGGYSCTKYLMCNPDTSDKSGNTFRCTCQGQQKCDRTGPLSKTRSGLANLPPATNSPPGTPGRQRTTRWLP